VLLVSFALCFAPLPCNTPSIAAVESLCTGQNILRIPSLLQIPRKSISQKGGCLYVCDLCT
ncbi:MAG: hypothetical protein K6F80_01100, partial [Oscillospiraceae bacterium]|nr:hypothetical protein [Oscillospiraceae bacterium]